MKKVFFLLCFCLNVACSQNSRIPKKPVIQPYILSPCAQSLIQSYRELISKPSSTLFCNQASDRKAYVTQSAMLAKCLYSSANASGFLTFPSFYVATGEDLKNSDKKHFYTNFTRSSHLGYGYYFGLCPQTAFPTTFAGELDTTKLVFKMPIVYPYPNISNKFVSEIFSVQLISIADYMAYRDTNDELHEKQVLGDMGIPKAIDINTIEEIKEAYIESQDGYVARNQAKRYQDIESSKGIVVNVKMKGSKVNVKCYLINNSDSGTLTWKMLNYIN